MEDSAPCEKEEGEKNAPSLCYRDKKEVFKGGLLGAFIGIAIIVPGLSGAVVAILLSMYERLLYAFGNLFKQFRRCAKFLLPIFIGAVLGIVGGFFGIRALLNLFPFAVIALFAGLMTGAYPALTDKIKGYEFRPPYIVLAVLGFAVPVAFSVVSVLCSSGEAALDNLQVYHYILFVLAGYAVAVTQLVPGLSATAFLMICGWFTPLMNSVSLSYWRSSPQIFIVYACLAVGFFVGLFTVSKGIGKLLEKFPAPSYYTVCGFSLGAAVCMFYNPETVAVYESWASAVPWVEIIVGVVLFIVGGVLSYFFVRVERKHGVETNITE